MTAVSLVLVALTLADRTLRPARHRQPSTTG